jgi:predicted nucleic acid-binding protein
MRYLLDTDIVIDLLTGHEPTRVTLAQLLPQGAAISILQITSRVLDLLIAATALKHNLTLVTRNVKDYDDIPDLGLYQRT